MYMKYRIIQWSLATTCKQLSLIFVLAIIFIFHLNQPHDISQVEEKMRMEGVRRQSAISQVRLENIIAAQGSADQALFYVLDNCPSQTQVRTSQGLARTHFLVANTDSKSSKLTHCQLEYQTKTRNW